MKPAHKPNVLVVMVDQLQAQRMKLYGGQDLLTPNLDRLAENGVTFKQAVTTSPLCTPSRQSLWTGQYPHTFGGAFNHTPALSSSMPYPRGSPSFPKILKESGYRTALIGKNHCYEDEVVGEHFDHCWEASHGRVMDSDPDPLVQEYERLAGFEFLRLTHGRILDLPDHVTTAALTTEKAIEWLQDVEEPFFLWLSYPEPHGPLVAPRRYAELYDRNGLKLPDSWKSPIDDKPANFREVYNLLGCEKLTEPQIRELTQIYYGMVSQVDDELARVLELLESKELDEKTVVVFLSDHGEYIGSHGMVQKSANLYDVLIRIPLIIRWTGHLQEGRMIDELVEHHDLMPTLCSLLDLPIPPGVQGKDLTGLLSGEDYEREAVFSEVGFHAPLELTRSKTFAEDLPWAEARAFFHFVFGHWAQRAVCIRTRSHKLVAYERGDRELYALHSDPEETKNIYGDPEFDSIERELLEALLNWSLSSHDPHPELMVQWDDVALRNRLKQEFARIPDAE